MNKTFTKTCIECGTTFQAVGPAGLYCSKSCGQKYRYKNNMRTTAYQYGLTSGNWKKYYQRRIGEKKRSSTLTVEELLEIHQQQNGKCALTGVDLTCQLIPGKKTHTNASLDRLDPKGEYTINNIQLVCVAVNRLRVDMSTEEFINWCRLVAENNQGV